VGKSGSLRDWSGRPIRILSNGAMLPDAAVAGLAERKPALGGGFTGYLRHFGNRFGGEAVFDVPAPGRSEMARR
jgi:hypothetical protein